ncbi:MAG: lysophospholipid acyltransferase family protein [Bdellovibrionota bacterium]
MIKKNIKSAYQTKKIFTKTLGYIFRSYAPGVSILALKKEWADEIIDLLGFKVEVVGEAPKNNSVILIGNHISYVDIIVLMSVHPQVVFLSKKEVASWPVIGAAARRIGTLFVDRSSKEHRQKVRGKIGELLSQGARHLAVFPSGTTTLDEAIPWKKGIFEIAADQKLPLQTFRISYKPLRACAYIGEDNLVLHLMNLFKTKNKKVRFEWLKQYEASAESEFIVEVQNETVKALMI